MRCVGPRLAGDLALRGAETGAALPTRYRGAWGVLRWFLLKYCVILG